MDKILQKDIKNRLLAWLLVFVFCAGLCPGLGTKPVKTEAATNQTVYLEENLLYWRFDDGKDKPTIILKTDKLPINNTYTKKVKDGDVPAFYDGTVFFADENPGSAKNYGDTLHNAGVIEPYNNATELIHRNAVEKDMASLFETWGNITYSKIYQGYDIVGEVAATDDNGRTIYSYTLPALLTEPGLLTYTVNYEGNAILIPMNPLTYYTDVQGKLVEVESDGNVKMQYAVEKAGVSTQTAKWILGTQTTTVRLEADYTYTRLVPLLDGNYKEKYFGEWQDRVENSYYSPGTGSSPGYTYYHSYPFIRTDEFNKNIVNSYPFSMQSSQYTGSKIISVFQKGKTPKYEEQYTDFGIYGDTSGNDTCVIGTGDLNPESDSTTYGEYYEDYAQFTSKVKDYINNVEYDVVSNCPVTSVQETVHYYLDIPCWIINTDMLKNDEKDKNLYIKDYLRDYIVTEEFHFTRGKGSFKVKYTDDNGFVVSGITRNTDLNWLKGTHISEAIGGYDGELIEWWAGNSTVHNYTTPANINNDIDVLKYKDFGVTLYFQDANKPIKVVKVKIRGRSKAPELKFKQKDELILINGLKAGSSAIRIANTDGTYRAMPAKARGYFETETYLLDGDAKNQNKDFYIYNGTKDKPLDLMTLFDMTDNSYFNALEGAYIETLKIQKGIPSNISALYVNDQRVFSTGSTSSHDSIVLENQSLKISDADANNIYEYSISAGSGTPAKWKSIKTNKAVKIKELTEGKTVYIRKASVSTKDKAYHLPSTFIKLTYSGSGQNLPNAYYMDDLYTNGSVEVKITNDIPRPQEIISASSGSGAFLAAPGESYSLGTTNAIYRQYIEEGRLITGLNENMCLNVSAGDKTVSLENIDNVEIKFSDLLNKLEAKYGNEWTDAYEKNGITSIAYGLIPQYRRVEVTATPADEDGYTAYFKDAKGNKIEYHPVHLLRYMLQQ
ncbi:MAG: hypothetical protein K6G81_12085 [Lachnospiraceae bacterium]|nr:hypothetical protein [Lachnospiraceae bacterium]